MPAKRQYSLEDIEWLLARYTTITEAELRLRFPNREPQTILNYLRAVHGARGRPRNPKHQISNKDKEWLLANYLTASYEDLKVRFPKRRPAQILAYAQKTLQLSGRPRGGPRWKSQRYPRETILAVLGHKAQVQALDQEKAQLLNNLGISKSEFNYIWKIYGGRTQ